MKNISFILLIFYVLSFVGCSVQKTPSSVSFNIYEELPEIAYSVQVGSFSKSENAWNFVENLNRQGLDAFLFKDKKTFKVRFGNYQSKEKAIQEAKKLKKKGYFDDFFVVAPQTLSANKKKSQKSIRDDIYQSSHGYIGVPYKWGGTTENGFDCSGLTHTVYRLNGISIPRTSIEQFKAGKSVSKENLKVGDLVFFATKRRKINHVGIYIGNGKFIHAPSKGKRVRTSNLNSKFWKRTYRGSRQYI